MLQGLMTNTPLLITSIMRFAEQYHGDREIVSVTADQPRHRYTYKAAFARARQLANVLQRFGLAAGDRVATLAWNDHRHFELYYAVSCSGAVCHTINPRLFVEQIAYIINHAEDQLVFVDPMFVPLLESLHEQLPSVRAYIVLTSMDAMPASDLPNLHCYEELLAAASDDFTWPELDENAASALCYTSGTTGDPKGVLYSHRSTVLHSYGVALPDVMGLRAVDCVMPLVPMFHVNAWGAPYALPMVGAKLVLPGPQMSDGETLQALIEEEQVNYSLGVPTVWLALLAYLKDSGKSVTALQRVCVGGAACPAAIIETFRTEHAVQVEHAWGMTELSPVGVYNAPKADSESLSPAALAARALKQGRALFGLELRIVNDAGAELPWDGKAFGSLQVRGPWVCERYFGADESQVDAAGWFNTGDVATIDAAGYMQITDRTKDVIKSGGEWISSIQLENTAVNHPAVAEAAVIGVAHAKWGERPLLIVVLAEGASPDRAALLGWFTDKVASWWVPDDVAFVEQLPHTATGKIKKTELRTLFSDYQLPDQD
jgi:acyl-CoA synthetase (AMP-forming)/AMP-acid ligase II